MRSFRGNLGPEPFRSYEEPIIIPSATKKFGKTHFRNRRRQRYGSTWVPSKSTRLFHCLLWTKKAKPSERLYSGKGTEKILVSFPPTNFGQTSTVSIWFCRIDMLELTASILGGKPPVYG